MEWYSNISNVVMLTAWMAENGYSAAAVAYAVEKPWKYEDEYRAALVDHHKQQEGR